MVRRAIITIFILAIFALPSCKIFRKKPTVAIRVVYPNYFYCGDKYANISRRIKEIFSDIEVKFIPRRVEEYGATFEKLHLFEFMPDIIIAPAELLPYLVEKDILTPLDEFVCEDDFFDIDDYNPKILEMFRYRDSLWMIPRNIKFSFIIYNKSLLEKHRIKFPEEQSLFTLTNLKEAIREISRCSELVRNNYIVYLPNVFPLFISSLDFDMGRINKDSIFNFITFLREVMEEKVVFSEPLSERDLLLNEKIVVFVENFHAVVLKNKLLKEKYNFIPLFGGKTLLSSDGVGITRRSKHKRASWEVVKILTSEVGLENFYEYELPANELLYEKFISNAEYKQILQWIKHAVLPLKHKNYNKIFHLINTEFISVSKAKKEDIYRKCIQLDDKIRRILK